MMTIGNVSGIYFSLKYFCDPVYYFFVAHHPHAVLNSFFSSKIIRSVFCALPFLHYFIRLFIVPESKKNISGLSAGGLDMIDAILFFFWPCQFMFFDQAFFIISYRTTTNQSGLRLIIHCKLVDIITRFAFAKNNRPADKCIQVFFCFVINFLAVNVGTRRKINLASSNMKK